MEKAMMVIFDYWESLDRNSRIEFRKRVLEETGIAMPTFYQKMQKKSFTLSECKVINSIIDEYVGARRIL